MSLYALNTPSRAPLSVAPGHWISQAGAVGTGHRHVEVRSSRSTYSSALNSCKSSVRLHYLSAHQVPYKTVLQYSPHLTEWDADTKTSLMVNHYVNNHMVITRISPIRTSWSTRSPSSKAAVWSTSVCLSGCEHFWYLDNPSLSVTGGYDMVIYSKNTYLVFVLISGTEHQKPWEFPKCWELQRCLLLC